MSLPVTMGTVSKSLMCVIDNLTAMMGRMNSTVVIVLIFLQVNEKQKAKTKTKKKPKQNPKTLWISTFHGLQHYFVLFKILSLMFAFIELFH